MKQKIDGGSKRRWNHQDEFREEREEFTQDRSPTNSQSMAWRKSSSFLIGSVESIHGETFDGLIGRSPVIRHVGSLIERVARTDATVLLRGESGTGKEVVARVIHRMSIREKRPFIAVHCGALSEGVIESELFGHERGAFTGAVRQHQGRFEQANGGTLFLDEIGDIGLATQVKLLRVLQERVFERVGGEKPITVDVRLLASTNQDLEMKIEEGSFRQDLYYRLNVVPIWLPPLRERPEDIPPLVEHFLVKYQLRVERMCTLSKEALGALITYPWPGNVRELENVLHRTLILASGPVIDLDDLQIPNGRGKDHRLGSLLARCMEAYLQAGFSLREELAECEKTMLRIALERAGGRVSQAGRLLGLSHTTLASKLKKYGLHSEGVSDNS